jgi:hypothetical protein
MSLVSDYVVRGRTLSDGRPSAKAGWAYDGAGGWYGGVAAAPARFPGRDRWEIETSPYGGFARRIAPDLSLDAGLRWSRYTLSSSRNYDEIYVGFDTDRLTGRLSLPARQVRTAMKGHYIELGYGQVLAGSLRGFARGGALLRTPASKPAAGIAIAPVQWDLRLGVTWMNDGLDYTMAAVGNRNAAWQAPSPGYADYRPGRPHDGLMASVACAF